MDFDIDFIGSNCDISECIDFNDNSNQYPSVETICEVVPETQAVCAPLSPFKQEQLQMAIYSMKPKVIQPERLPTVIPGEILLGSLNNYTNDEFTRGDPLSVFKSVDKITQTRFYLNIELSNLEQPASHAQALSEITERIQSEFAFCNSQAQQRRKQGSFDTCFDNESTYQNITSSFSSSDSSLTHFDQNEESASLESSFVLTKLKNYLQQQYESHHKFETTQSLKEWFEQVNSLERFNQSNKRAFSVLKKFAAAKDTSLFTYKIVRRTPGEQATSSRGLSNALIDLFEMKKQDAHAFILRNKTFPFSSSIKASERILNSIDEAGKTGVISDISSRKVQLTSDDLIFQFTASTQVIPLNNQLGYQSIDINDYLIITVFQEDQQVERKMRKQQKQMRIAASSDSETEKEYRQASNSIVEKYYKSYSEEKRYETQIQRLLLKKNHKFR